MNDENYIWFFSCSAFIIGVTAIVLLLKAKPNQTFKIIGVLTALCCNFVAGLKLMGYKEPEKENISIIPIVEKNKPISKIEKILFIKGKVENEQEIKSKATYEHMDASSAYSILKKFYWLYNNDKISEDEYISLKQELLAGVYDALNSSKDFTDYELDKFHCELLVECKKMLDDFLITDREFKYLKGEI